MLPHRASQYDLKVPASPCQGRARAGIMTNVLTLRLDAEQHAYFENLRQRHFPLERNQIPAHLTLFHTLPDEPGITSVLNFEAERQKTFVLAVTGLRSLGKGVAYTLQSAALLALHGRLADALADHLTAQDKQKLQPHIVVQNKVTSAAALDLLMHLRQTFVPMQVQAVGMDLWHYMGGPWKHARTFAFVAAP